MNVREGDRVAVNIAPFIGSALRSEQTIPCTVLAVLRRRGSSLSAAAFPRDGIVDSRRLDRKSARAETGVGEGLGNRSRAATVAFRSAKVALLSRSERRLSVQVAQRGTVPLFFPGRGPPYTAFLFLP